MLSCDGLTNHHLAGFDADWRKGEGKKGGGEKGATYYYLLYLLSPTLLS